MKNNTLTIGTVLALVLLVVFANQPETLSRNISLWDKEYIRPPFPDAGWDIVTYVGSETHFDGQVQPGDGQITSYEWDFDGDGTFDWFNSQSGFALHTYLTIGEYQTFFQVTDEYGLSNIDTVQVIVKPGKGPQRFVKPKVKKPKFAQGKTSKDGVINRYAIILGPDSFEARFWEAVDTFFNAFNQVLGIDSSDIYVLYDSGHPPEGFDQGDSVIIDYPVSQACLDTVFDRLVNEHQIDGDDHLYIIIPGHGLTGIDPRVQPGDEPDSLESNYSPPTPSISLFPAVLEQWFGVWEGDEYYRQKYVSHFEDLHLECTDSDTTDNDIWLELLLDFLAGDTVPPYGTINEGDVINFDGDAVAAYDDTADTFDQDDWGYIDTIMVENAMRQRVPKHWSFLCAFFDSSLDNTIDIDVDCVPWTDTPYVDGTDTDNDGLFNGIDMNSDGDMDDTVSIDEIISGIDITDDVLAEYLDSLGERPTLVAMVNCFSGGFIWDLSGPKQVTMTGCREHETCSGYFLHKIAETIFDPAIADSLDADSCVSLAEAFNYAAKKYETHSIPVYDDNGDREGHSYPIPDSGDGFWGRRLFFEEDCATASYLFYYSHETDDSEGDDNGEVNPGDIINMEVTLENLDFDTAESVEAILRTDDSFIEITDSLETYGDIPPADTATCSGEYVFSIDSDCPDSHSVTFNLHTYAGDTLVGHTSFYQLVVDPDFMLTVEPETLIRYLSPLKGAGKSGSPQYKLIVLPVGGFDTTVSFSTSGFCPGTGGSVRPSQVIPPDTASLLLWIPFNPEFQVCSTIVITATGGGKTYQDTVVLIDREAPPNTGPVWHVATDGHDLLGDGKESWPVRTIQKGIDLAPAGDTVLVKKGTYEEDILIEKDSIVVASHYARDEQESYIESTIIHDPDSGWVVTIESCDEVTLCGFTIRNGLSKDRSIGGGISGINSQASILHNFITGNELGIRIKNSLSTYLFRNLIYYNSNHAIYLILCSNCQIINNSVSNNQSMGIQYDNGSGSIKNNIISSNSRYGILRFPEGDFDIAFNDVWDNAWRNYSGIPDCTDSNGNISENPRFVDSTADFHLTCYSPCIDYGDTADSVPEGGGSRIDMGAFEFQYSSTDTICGDLDYDGCITWRDYQYLIDYLYSGGPAPDPEWIADFNCDDEIDLWDQLYLFSYLNGTGPAPCTDPACD